MKFSRLPCIICNSFCPKTLASLIFSNSRVSKLFVRDEENLHLEDDTEISKSKLMFVVPIRCC